MMMADGERSTTMITYHSGDLLTDDADALVNPVNTVGVMGKGLALQFKQAYPAMFEAYRRRCDQGFHIGQLFVYGDHPRLVCLPTKWHWRYPSFLSDVVIGIEALRVWSDDHHDVRSIAVPPLGCGLGGLPWALVHAHLVDIFDDSDVDLRIYGRRL